MLKKYFRLRKQLFSNLWGCVVRVMAGNLDLLWVENKSFSTVMDFAGFKAIYPKIVPSRRMLYSNRRNGAFRSSMTLWKVLENRLWVQLLRILWALIGITWELFARATVPVVIILIVLPGQLVCLWKNQPCSLEAYTVFVSLLEQCIQWQAQAVSWLLFFISKTFCPKSNIVYRATTCQTQGLSPSPKDSSVHGMGPNPRGTEIKPIS